MGFPTVRPNKFGEVPHAFSDGVRASLSRFVSPTSKEVDRLPPAYAADPSPLNANGFTVRVGTRSDRR